MQHILDHIFCLYKTKPNIMCLFFIEPAISLINYHRSNSIRQLENILLPSEYSYHYSSNAKIVDVVIHVLLSLYIKINVYTSLPNDYRSQYSSNANGIICEMHLIARQVPVYRYTISIYLMQMIFNVVTYIFYSKWNQNNMRYCKYIQTSLSGKSTPASMAIFLNKVDKNLIFKGLYPLSFRFFLEG